MIARIDIVGDVCLKHISDESYQFSNDLYEYLSQADLRIANLECALTNSEIQLPYQPIHLKGKPERCKIFDIFDAYTLANNHVMDYCDKGMMDTIAFLRENDKYYCGAGINKYEALQPAIISLNGIRVALLTFNRFNVATRKSAGTAPEDISFIEKQIRKLKDDGCFVIVYPHWNYQWIDYPAPDERKKGYRMIDAGADIVVGAHPHIVQGYEIYKGKMIYHSLGNFVFRNTKYTKNIVQFGQSFVLSVLINDDFSYSVNILPTFTNNDGVRIMESNEKEMFLQHLNEISHVLLDNQALRKHFYESAKVISKNNAYVYSEVSKQGGVRGILKQYTIANWQDVKRKLYAIFC